MRFVPFSWHHAIYGWTFSPFPTFMLVLLILAGAWYLRSVRRLSARGRSWSGKRTTAFLLGLIGIEIAFQSSISIYTGSYFQAHVFQHLLLMVVAPPFLAMGAPMTLALQTSTRTTKTRLLGVLNSRTFQVLTHPVPVWFLYYFSMFAFFLTSALGFAMNHMWVMDLVNLGFLFASTLFWWPVVGLDPIPHWNMSYGARMVNLLIGIPVESFLGLALLTSTTSAASMYTVSSTHAGGGLLWMGAEIFTMLALIPIFVQWMRAEERKAARYDAQVDAAKLAGVKVGQDGTLQPVTAVPWNATGYDNAPTPASAQRARPAKRKSQWLPPSRVEDPVNS
jgi:putative membrane protein